MRDASDVVVFPAPEEEVPSDDYEVRVNGERTFVYRARVSAVPFNQVWPGYQRPLDQTELASFAYWDMSGPVTVEVVAKRPVESVAVRPTSYGLQPALEDGKIVFQMPRPMQVTVEMNGPHHALHLFASPLEEKRPSPADQNVRYFGPGVHRVGLMELNSGETVYIAGGAVVHGAIRATEVSDIRILGRGILDVSTFKRREARGAIGLCGCTDVAIEGIVIRDPNVWTVIPAGCQRVAISNIKLIGLWRYNADGIDVVNSQHVTIERCFIRSFDDSIVIKGLTGWAKYPTGHLPVRDVTVQDCVIWNDWGRALEIGAETVAPEIRDVVFRNCDIIRTAHIALDIQHGDRAAVRDVRFEDIRFEIDEENPRPRIQTDRSEEYTVKEGDDYCPRLLVLEIKKTGYSKDDERGTINGVHVKDVAVSGGPFPTSYLCGYDPEHRVENVTIENVCVNGRPITDAEGGRFSIREHVHDVRFLVNGRGTAASPTGGAPLQ